MKYFVQTKYPLAPRVSQPKIKVKILAHRLGKAKKNLIKHFLTILFNGVYVHRTSVGFAFFGSTHCGSLIYFAGLFNLAVDQGSTIKSHNGTETETPSLALGINQSIVIRGDWL